ncbi:MAG: NAD(P)-dependent glycerol-3-phosphate dehydrogenase [Armatimonadetes bacterium]|nr:NAD(P)-dependent glycerol-3-phosphate dehydrogenase [Armatimonadota bacterium]
MDITVVGSGSWGSALTVLLARNGHEVILGGKDEEDILSMRSLRENLKYLPGFAFPDSVRFELLRTLEGQADMIVVAVPAAAVRSVVTELKTQAPIIVVAAKGLEPAGYQIPTDIVAELRPGVGVGVLSGPNLAKEIAKGIPTAAVAAFADIDDAETVQRAFMCATFRVYVSTDVVGVELAGALKNVLAIGAGMSDALGYGDNTKGALLARGLHEMTRLGLAMGAKIDTFLGLAGVGDLFATASSNLSRNYRVGFAIGQGNSLKDAIERVEQIAEGVPTSESALILARRHGIQMPVFEAIEGVLRGRIPARQAVSALMERIPRTETLLDLK